MKYQVTFFSEKYKPVACIIESESRARILTTDWKKAAVKICTKRGWTRQDMADYGYTTFKSRLAE